VREPHAAAAAARGANAAVSSHAASGTRVGNLVDRRCTMMLILLVLVYRYILLLLLLLLPVHSADATHPGAPAEVLARGIATKPHLNCRRRLGLCRRPH
jgi:hypothetical protein